MIFTAIRELYPDAPRWLLVLESEKEVVYRGPSATFAAELYRELVRYDLDQECIAYIEGPDGRLYDRNGWEISAEEAGLV